MVLSFQRRCLYRTGTYHVKPGSQKMIFQMKEIVSDISSMVVMVMVVMVVMVMLVMVIVVMVVVMVMVMVMVMVVMVVMW